MARFNIADREPISLFPMFNILIGILGCLILIMGSVMALSLGAERRVSIDSEVGIGGRHQKKPTYIEWNGKEVVIHPKLEHVSLDLTNVNPSEKEIIEMAMKILERTLYDEGALIRQIRALKFNRIKSQFSGTAFENIFLNISATKNDNYIVLLVRPSGFKTLLTFRDFILDEGINVGYEPIGQNWSVGIK